MAVSPEPVSQFFLLSTKRNADSGMCAGLLAFPNVVQHRVSPFRLADPTRPGHRKLLALFLVDPHIRILSTYVHFGVFLPLFRPLFPF